MRKLDKIDLSTVGSQRVPPDRKYALTIKEAAEYFNIGTNKLYEIANDPYNDAILRVGNHKLFKREKFAKQLDELFIL